MYGPNGEGPYGACDTHACMKEMCMPMGGRGRAHRQGLRGGWGDWVVHGRQLALTELWEVKQHCVQKGLCTNTRRVKVVVK